MFIFNCLTRFSIYLLYLVVSKSGVKLTLACYLLIYIAAKLQIIIHINKNCPNLFVIGTVLWDIKIGTTYWDIKTLVACQLWIY